MKRCSQHRLHDLADGVLELGVVWDYDHRNDAPVSEIRHARVRGLQPELKKKITKAPLGEFNIPMIVQGKVRFASHAANNEREPTSQLRIARNEGGAITLAAQPETRSARMLVEVAGGDPYEGARALFSHIDAMTLPSID